MKLFKCWICDRVFDEENAAEQREIHDEVRPHYVERFLACPFCGSTYYDDYNEGEEDDDEASNP